MKQQQQYRIVVLHSCMVVLMAGAISGNVAAREVYNWTDKNGIVNYSDMPPDEQEAQIIEFKETRLDNSNETDSIAGGSQPNADARNNADGKEAGPPQSAADAKRKKIAADRIQRRETRTEMEQMCAQHRQRLARIEPHRRVYYKDKNGKTVRMDDNQRIAKVNESKQYIAKNCG